jgi:hypothetical protein
LAVSQSPAPTPPPSPAEAVDARGDRAAEAAIGVILLAGFVFRFPLLLPIMALLVGAGAVAGPRANVFRLAADRLLVPRLPPAREAGVAAATVRAQDAFVAGACALGALTYVVVSGVGWLLAIAAAVVAIVAATTGVHFGARLLRRVFRS